MRYARESRNAYVLILPALLIVAMFTLYPTIYASILSLYDCLPGKACVFVGFSKYMQLFSSGLFWHSLKVTLIFVFASVSAQIIIGTLIALLIYYLPKGSNILKTLLIIPWALPGVISAAMWRTILDYDYGLINGVLRALNVCSPDEGIKWLLDPNLALLSLILIDIWRLSPFVALLVLAGLVAIPKSYIDAAEIDGASTIQKFIHIMLPFLKPIYKSIFIIRSIFAFQALDIVFVTTKGGPGTATYLLPYYMYNEAFAFLDFGGGAALAVILALLIVITICIFYYIVFRTLVRTP